MDRLFVDSLPARVNGNERLVWRGRHVSTTFLIQYGAQACIVQIDKGRVNRVAIVPPEFSDWAFALRASQQAWGLFFSEIPPPGFHDLMAMLKLKHLKMEGDLYPLMSHLLYFKDVLASLRNSGSTPSVGASQ